MISRIAIPRIGGIFEARAKRIEGDFAEAQRAQGAIRGGARGLREVARRRAQPRPGDRRNETRDKLNAEAEERRKALEAELNAQLAEAEKTIAATKIAAMANVRGIAVDAASAIVRAADRHGAGRRPRSRPRSPTR